MELKVNQKRYSEEMFLSNNRISLVLSVFLFVEQLIYSYIFTDIASEIGKNHIITAFISLLYMLILGMIFLQNRKKIVYSLWKAIVQYSFIFFGIGVSIYRAIYIPYPDFRIPVIYIAVLYGSAFFFYYPPIWSLCMYGVTSIAFINLGYYENQNLLYSTFIQDIVANNILAWIGAVLSYKSFIKQINSIIVIEGQNKELIRLSGIDTLTQLYNRRKINEYLENIHSKAEKSDKVYVVIIADIDNFKQVNDMYGHNIGDEVLVNVANIFNNKLEKQYFLGRWGGEEFMIVCEDISIKEVGNLVEQVRTDIEKYEFKLGRQITCSFGVSEYKVGLLLEEVVKNADIALYKSKNTGKNRVSIV